MNDNYTNHDSTVPKRSPFQKAPAGTQQKKQSDNNTYHKFDMDPTTIAALLTAFLLTGGLEDPGSGCKCSEDTKNEITKRGRGFTLPYLFNYKAIISEFGE